MSRTIVKSCSSTRIFKGIAERFFGQRFAILAADERKLSGRPRIKCPLQNRQDRDANNHLATTLFRPQGGNAIAHMLATEPDSVATTEAGVEQHIAPDSFLSAYRPSLVVGGSIGFGPHREARTFFALRVLHTKRRIDSEVGHLNNEDAAGALLEIITKETHQVVLAHLSETNNLPRLAEAAVIGALRRNEVTGVEVHAASQDEPGEVIS